MFEGFHEVLSTDEGNSASSGHSAAFLLETIYQSVFLFLRMLVLSDLASCLHGKAEYILYIEE